MKKHTVSIAVAAFVGVFLLAFIGKKLLTSTYTVSVAEQISQLTAAGAKFSLLNYALALKTNDPNVLLIDIRSEDDYKQGHLPNAINIPINKLFDKEYNDFIGGGDHLTKVLYGNNEAQALNALLMLTLRGKKGFKMLNGSYDVAYQFVVNNPTPSYFHYSDELKRHNYNSLMPAGGRVSTYTPKGAASIEPIAPRGGC